jgi:hypothetical protein
MAKAGRATAEILSLDEVNDRYFGEWVLLRITNRDEGGAISHGEVLRHSKSRAAISRAVARAHEEDPKCQLYLFVGGTRKVTGDELREALRKAADEEEYVNVNW